MNEIFPFVRMTGNQLARDARSERQTFLRSFQTCSAGQ
jgi:hypothetical protein